MQALADASKDPADFLAAVSKTLGKPPQATLEYKGHVMIAAYEYATTAAKGDKAVIVYPQQNDRDKGAAIGRMSSSCAMLTVMKQEQMEALKGKDLDYVLSLDYAPCNSRAFAAKNPSGTGTMPMLGWSMIGKDGKVYDIVQTSMVNKVIKSYSVARTPYLKRACDKLDFAVKDTRSFWRFAPEHGNGYFKKQKDGKWIEIGRNGERMGTWVEKTRTDDYVEMEDSRRGYVTRLGAGAAWMANVKDRKFNPSPEGDWVTDK